MKRGTIVVSVISVIALAAACGKTNDGGSEIPDGVGQDAGSGGLLGAAGAAASGTAGQAGSPAEGGSSTGGAADGGDTSTGGNTPNGGANTGGVSPTGGVTGSGGEAGSVEPGPVPPANCVPTDPSLVTVRIHFTPSLLPAEVFGSLIPPWWTEQVTVQDWETQQTPAPDLYLVNADLAGDGWLVQGEPDLTLGIPESDLEVWFGCTLAVLTPLTGSVAMDAYSAGYGWRVGETGPNLFICGRTNGCTVNFQ